MTWMKLRGLLFSWAMKTAATHWKRAAPSMLTVAPMGRMKRLMCLETPFFSSTHFIIRGRVAELRGEGRQVTARPGEEGLWNSLPQEIWQASTGTFLDKSQHTVTAANCF